MTYDDDDVAATALGASSSISWYKQNYTIRFNIIVVRTFVLFPFLIPLCEHK